MIYDSIIWKDELKQKTIAFKKLIDETPFSLEWMLDAGADGLTSSYKFFIEFQKFCFYVAVIARKFIESNRLSDELASKTYKVKVFGKTSDKKLTKDNFESIENEYDITNVKWEELTLNKICHLFVHSFVFSPHLNEFKLDESQPDEIIENWEIDGINGLYINTDYSKNKNIYYFVVEQLFEIFKEVYEDSIVYYEENRQTGIIIRSNQRRN